MAQLNDGSLPTGSLVLTINSVAYVAEDISYNPGNSQMIERRDQLNEPSGCRYLKDFCDGTATLQLATSSTAIPPTASDSTNGGVATFTGVDIGEGTGVTYIVHQVGNVFRQGDIRKVNISFRKKIN